MNRALKFVAGAALAATAAVASAADVNVLFQNTYGDTLSTNPAVFDGGVFTATGTAAATGGGAAVEYQLFTSTSPLKSFAAYCLDPIKANGGNGAKYNITSATLDAVSRLFAVSGFNGQTYGSDGVNTGIKASALQLAIWEVGGDGLQGTGAFYSATDLPAIAGTATATGVDNDGAAAWLNFNSASAGLFRASGFSYDVVSQAAVYLNAAAALSVGSYVPTVSILTPTFETGDKQRLVTSVPEPSTYALLAACLGVVGFATRRKMS
jgi:PEP-CTERM motif